MIFRNFINGDFVSPSSDFFIEKLSPFDGSSLGKIPKSSAMDFIQALQGAKKAAPEMKNLSFIQRADKLQKMSDELESSKQEISYQEALHQGLSADFVLVKSIEPAIYLIRQIANQLRKTSESESSYQPVGVISLVCSWQLSLFLILERLAPALAAGNTVLIKASENCPGTAESLGQILKVADFPQGAVQILQGDHELAQLMTSHPGVAAVTAVGRQATLEAIARSGISPLKKIQLAGPAKNVTALISGFDLENDFLKVMESFLMGQGQLCWNSTRLLLLESIAVDFYKKLQDFLATLAPLKDPSGNSVWTPLISKQAKQKLQDFRLLALAEKGSLFNVEMSEPSDGFYSAPVFMKDLTNCSVLHQDELQSPLFLVNTVKYQHEISKWANNSYLSHSCFIWGDLEKSQKVANSIEASDIHINNWQSNGVRTVFGAKQSSFGNLDMAWNGSFYSDVKKLTGALTRQSSV